MSDRAPKSGTSPPLSAGEAVPCVSRDLTAFRRISLATISFVASESSSSALISSSSALRALAARMRCRAQANVNSSRFPGASRPFRTNSCPSSRAVIPGCSRKMRIATISSSSMRSARVVTPPEPRRRISALSGGEALFLPDKLDFVPEPIALASRSAFRIRSSSSSSPRM